MNKTVHMIFKFGKIEIQRTFLGVPIHPAIPIHPDRRYIKRGLLVHRI